MNEKSFWVKIGVAAVAMIAISVTTLIYLYPAPPNSVTIATAFRGASFEYYGKRYKERLERLGLKVEIRETAGAVENVALLQNPKSGVDIGFVTGGVSDASRAPDLFSLGTIFIQPFWIFYIADEHYTSFEQLKGKRIAVGPPGSGTQFSAESVLGKAGINSSTATMTPFAGNDAAAALDAGTVDVVWIIGAPRVSAVQALLRNPKVKLLSMPMAEAFTRTMPELVKITLPQGAIDIEKTIPPHEVTLLATTTKVVVRNDFHPELVYPLLQTMIAEHSGSDIFQKTGEYPMAMDTEYPLAAAAADFYKYGPSLLHRHLPLWLTTHAQRLIALFIAAIAIGVPFFSYVPRVYRWVLKHSTRSVYGEIGRIEKALSADLSVEQLRRFQKELEALDHEASRLRFPRRHLDLMFSVKVHINLVRSRLASRIDNLNRLSKNT